MNVFKITKFYCTGRVSRPAVTNTIQKNGIVIRFSQ